ncbi:MAG: hypothetical protein ACRDOL_13295 [Streptosporangiaceae bacterium]
MKPVLVPLDGPPLTTLLTRDQVRPEDRDAYDAMKAFDERIARVLAANGGEVICPRSKRPSMGWPLRRPNNCGDRQAVSCLRDPEIILAGRTGAPDDTAARIAREQDGIMSAARLDG